MHDFRPKRIALEPNSHEIFFVRNTHYAQGSHFHLISYGQTRYQNSVGYLISKSRTHEKYITAKEMPNMITTNFCTVLAYVSNGIVITYALNDTSKRIKVDADQKFFLMYTKWINRIIWYVM